jgi:hypothetical protein
MKVVYWIRFFAGVLVVLVGIARAFEPDNQSFDKLSEELIGVIAGAGLIAQKEHA